MATSRRARNVHIPRDTAQERLQAAIDAFFSQPGFSQQTLPHAALERLWGRRDVALRDRTLWRLLYETAARASEALSLNVEDLDLPCAPSSAARTASATTCIGRPVPGICSRG